jgi:Flp pilus assembly pilin Flp
MTQFLMRIWYEDEAQNMPEYALLLILVCMTSVTVMSVLATRVNNICSSASTHIAAASGKPAMPSGAFSITTENPVNGQSKSQVDKDLMSGS